MERGLYSLMSDQRDSSSLYRNYLLCSSIYIKSWDQCKACLFLICSHIYQLVWAIKKYTLSSILIWDLQTRQNIRDRYNYFTYIIEYRAYFDLKNSYCDSHQRRLRRPVVQFGSSLWKFAKWYSSQYFCLLSHSSLHHFLFSYYCHCFPEDSLSVQPAQAYSKAIWGF